MACMRARRSLKFGAIRLLTTELAGLGRMKKNHHRLIIGKTVSSVFTAVYDPILKIIAGNKEMHISLYNSNLVKI